MKRYIFAGLLGVTLTAAGVVAQDADDAPAQSEARELAAAAAAQTADEVADEAVDEEDPGEEVVCRRERVTGSLTRVRRTCLTRNEWDQLERNTGQGHSDMVRGASGSQCIPSDPTTGRC